MKIIRGEKELASFLSLLKRRSGGEDKKASRTALKIIERVKKEGDAALRELTLRLDGHRSIRLPERQIERLARKAEPALVEALRFAARRIRDFHERQLRIYKKSWFYEKNGIKLGQIVRPLERVGVYVPGGRAVYPSTVLMNVIPAMVAGVREIAVAMPSPGGRPDPGAMAALRLLGVKEAYSIGGAQAIAAFAYGTGTIRKVDKITGPGNIFVAEAKRLVFGQVDIDMIAGPSEILIIADGSAEAALAAADMLSQAEHDRLASAVLVTDSAALARAVSGELKRRLKLLSRQEIASASLEKYGAIILARDMDEACRIADSIAPEHLEVLAKNPGRMIKKIKNAGAVFAGPWSPEPIGDYVAGPNHTLPTGGTARFSSPLGVYDFLKATSYLKLTRAGFERLAPAAERIAEAEGLTAHKNSISVRRIALKRFRRN